MAIPLLKKGNVYELFEVMSFLGDKKPSLQYCFDYVVLCLFRDRLLPQVFDYGLLFSLLSKYEKKIQTYLASFASPSKTFLAAAEKLLGMVHTLSQESALASVASLIETSSILSAQEELLHVVVGKDAVLLKDTFDDDFLASLFSIFLIQQGKSLDTQLFLEQGKEPLLLQHLLLQQLLLQRVFYEEIVWHPPLLDKK